MDIVSNIEKSQVVIGNNHDMLSEVWAAALLEYGFAFDSLIISRQSVVPKCDNTINKIELKYPILHPDDVYVNIEAKKSSIYDTLPEDIFFMTHHREASNDIKTIVKKVRANRENEKWIRKYFSLFEAECSGFNILLKYIELKFDMSSSYRNNVDFFAQQWTVIKLMSIDEANRFIRCIPYLYESRGCYESISEILSYILAINISVRQQSKKKSYNENYFISIDNMSLGYNSVLCGDSSSFENFLKIIIRDINMDEAKHYFNGNKKIKILDTLLDMLVEAKIERHVEIVPQRAYKEQISEIYLGVNSFI